MIRIRQILFPKKVLLEDQGSYLKMGHAIWQRVDIKTNSPTVWHVVMGSVDPGKINVIAQKIAKIKSFFSLTLLIIHNMQ